MAKQPLTLLIHRGTRSFAVHDIPGTVWEGNVQLKLLAVVPGWVANALLLCCAFLIAMRRAATPEGRILALILLLLAVPAATIVIPDAAATAFSTIASSACGLVAVLLLVALSSRFGVRTVWRRVFEGCAYGIFILNAASLTAFTFGLFTLTIDPLKYLPNYTSGLFSAASLPIALSIALAISVVLVAVAAVRWTTRSERSRAAWLLLPIPFALLVADAISSLAVSVQTWDATQVLYLLSSLVLLIGAMTVTYALLKRRVLDFGFVLSRTIVVAIVSLVVVVSFVLLEWVLGTLLVGVSHVTGLLANAGLALVLGLSMNVIHKRVDAAVDTILFRKRHDDERALRAFSKEAAYVTEPKALFDQAIIKIEAHTDARNAAMLVHATDSFTPVRSFGGYIDSVGENDAAILALKTWHKPLDPHHYATSLKGALAVPMVARGRLLGVLLLGERAGGEAYAPDEVEALSQFAHGVGSALDGLSSNNADSIAALRESMTAMAEAIASLPRAIAMELRDSTAEHRSA
jgi:hypothetical protein